MIVIGWRNEILTNHIQNQRTRVRAGTKARSACTGLYGASAGIGRKHPLPVGKQLYGKIRGAPAHRCDRRPAAQDANGDVSLSATRVIRRGHTAIRRWRVAIQRLDASRRMRGLLSAVSAMRRHTRAACSRPHGRNRSVIRSEPSPLHHAVDGCRQCEMGAFPLCSRLCRETPWRAKAPLGAMVSQTTKANNETKPHLINCRRASIALQ